MTPSTTHASAVSNLFNFTKRKNYLQALYQTTTLVKFKRRINTHIRFTWFLATE